MREADEARHAAERVARDSYGRLVAYLSARTRDLAGAEDALGEAFATALRIWPIEGVPQNPDAWLLTVARRRQTDQLRRRGTQRAGEPTLMLLADETAEGGDDGDIPDRRLGLMFACAHPAIERGLRAPLILQTLLGFNAIDIAAAFLIPPATMGQRLVRAKTRLRDAGIPFAIPPRAEMAERLEAVLDAVYAIYGKGWSEWEEDGKESMAGEAIWLGQLLARLLPDAPEALGLVALMGFAEARRPARRTADGAYVPLEAQDVALWNDSLIRQANDALRQANGVGLSGRYQLEAAIQSAHVHRRLTGNDTWPAITALYAHLVRLTGSPVAQLNHAAALAHTEGAEAALAAIAPLSDDRRMQSYQPYWATLGHLHAEAGHRAEAHEALTVAMGLATDPAVRAYLQQKRRALPAD